MLSVQKKTKGNQLLFMEWLKSDLANFIFKGRAYYLFFIAFSALFSALLEMFTVASIYPFVQLIINQESVEIFGYNLIVILNNPSREELIAAFIFLTFLSVIARVFLNYIQINFCTSLGHDLASEIYLKNIGKDYENHLRQDPSFFISAITKKSTDLIDQFALPLLNVASSTLLLLIILFAVIATNPILAFVFIGVFVLIYGLILFFTRRVLVNLGHVVEKSTNTIYKIAQESVSAFRDIKIYGNTELYTEKFKLQDLILRRAIAFVQIFATSPKFIVEGVALILMAVIAVFMSGSSLEGEFIPSIAVIAIAGQKLIPILQQIYASLSVIRGSKALVGSLNQLLSFEPDKSYKGLVRGVFLGDIELHNISYAYPIGENVLNDVSLTIPSGKVVGITGDSGKGKSTLMDLLMGLLVPKNGYITIGENVLTKSNVQTWYRQISHVAQNVFVFNGSLEDNITMRCQQGSSGNMNLDYIIESLELGALRKRMRSLNEGERGLSGGQRQRIAIARALYRGGNYIFLDEMTSALDDKMTIKVFDLFKSLSSTVVIISHDQRIMDRCDEVIDFSLLNKSNA